MRAQVQIFPDNLTDKAMTVKNIPPEAVIAAQKTMRGYGIPASATLAQAILESGWFQHHLAEAHNYFGIKGSSAWGFVEVPTREYVPLKGWVVVKAPFRRYPGMLESFLDHARFLIENPRYQQALAVTQNPDFSPPERSRRFCQELARAGYATDPNYAQLLIQIMEDNQLYRYDEINQEAVGIAPKI